MSDRIDTTLEHEQDAAVTTVAGVASEVITSGGPRRRWSSAARARIVAESLEPGAVAWKVAERHGLTRWQLYDWRRKVRAAAGGTRPKRNGSTSKVVDVLPEFAPVVMAAPAMPPQPTASEASTMEIAIGDASVRVRGVVDVEGLVAVLSAVRRVS
jgi:transposase